jgi:hypothetical protein
MTGRCKNWKAARRATADLRMKIYDLRITPELTQRREDAKTRSRALLRMLTSFFQELLFRASCLGWRKLTLTMNPKENSKAGAIKLALIPAFSPEEKVNRRQTVGNVAGWNQVLGFNARIFRGILTPALSPRRGRIIARWFETSGDGSGSGVQYAQ